MDSYQAVEYGIIDSVIETTQAIPATEQSSNGAGNLVKSDALKV